MVVTAEAPAVEEGNFVGNKLAEVGQKFEETSQMLNLVPEIGNVAAGIFKVGGTGIDMMASLANMQFKKMAHDGVSGLTAAVTRTSEALLPGFGDVDTAAGKLTGTTISQQVGKDVADKLVGKIEPKAAEVPEKEKAELQPKTDKDVDIQNGILEAKVTEKPNDKGGINPDIAAKAKELMAGLNISGMTDVQQAGGPVGGIAGKQPAKSGPVQGH